MSRRLSIAQIFLWLFVIVLGIAIGGGLYEQLVVVPLWSNAPPDSVLAYHQHNVANPQFALNQGGRFWMFFTPLSGLLAVAALVSGLRTQTAHRKWRIAGTALTLIVIVLTFVWFVPNIILLTGERATELNAERITSLTNCWVRLNWARAAALIAAWLAGLRALMISPGSELES